MLNRYRLLAANTVLLLALIGSLWAQRSEGSVVPYGDFLREVRLPFRGWPAKDHPLSEVEFQTLLPDSALLRMYEGPKGQAVDLTVIAGHRKRTVHHPGYCMVGGGWDAVSQRRHTMRVGDREVTVTRVLMTKENQAMVGTYFFTDGELATTSMQQFQWSQLKQRLQGKTPLGALVRVLVPVVERGNEGVLAAEKLSDDFAGELLPTVLQSMREARSRHAQRPVVRLMAERTAA